LARIRTFLLKRALSDGTADKLRCGITRRVEAAAAYLLPAPNGGLFCRLSGQCYWGPAKELYLRLLLRAKFVQAITMNGMAGIIKMQHRGTPGRFDLSES